MDEKRNKEKEGQSFIEESCILSPVSWKIVQALKESESGMHIRQLAESIGEDKREVAFHSITLQRHDFITGEYGVIEHIRNHSSAKGKIGNVFKLTEKGVIAHDAIKSVLPELLRCH